MSDAVTRPSVVLVAFGFLAAAGCTGSEERCPQRDELADAYTVSLGGDTQALARPGDAVTLTVRTCSYSDPRSKDLLIVHVEAAGSVAIEGGATSFRMLADPPQERPFVVHAMNPGKGVVFVNASASVGANPQNLSLGFTIR